MLSTNAGIKLLFCNYSSIFLQINNINQSNNWKAINAKVSKNFADFYANWPTWLPVIGWGDNGVTEPQQNIATITELLKCSKLRFWSQFGEDIVLNFWDGPGDYIYRIACLYVTDNRNFRRQNQFMEVFVPDQMARKAKRWPTWTGGLTYFSWSCWIYNPVESDNYGCFDHVPLPHKMCPIWWRKQVRDGTLMKTVHLPYLLNKKIL